MGTMPGVMLYFDLRPCLDHLTREEQGMLFQAILDYGETGCPPELPGALAIAWAFIQPRLDRDRARYEAKVAQSTQAIRSRWQQLREQRAGLSEGKTAAAADRDVYGRIPTTTTATAASASATQTHP